MFSGEGYRIKETLEGGKRCRYCHFTFGDKEKARHYARGMKKAWGDKYVYRVVRNKRKGG